MSVSSEITKNTETVVKTETRTSTSATTTVTTTRCKITKRRFDFDLVNKYISTNPSHSEKRSKATLDGRQIIRPQPISPTDDFQLAFSRYWTQINTAPQRRTIYSARRKQRN
jgi:hypothetical protein